LKKSCTCHELHRMKDDSAFHLLCCCPSLISPRMRTFSKSILGVDEYERAPTTALLLIALIAASAIYRRFVDILWIFFPCADWSTDSIYLFLLWLLSFSSVWCKLEPICDLRAEIFIHNIFKNPRSRHKNRLLVICPLSIINFWSKYVLSGIKHRKKIRWKIIFKISFFQIRAVQVYGVMLHIFRQSYKYNSSIINLKNKKKTTSFFNDIWKAYSILNQQLFLRRFEKLSEGIQFDFEEKAAIRFMDLIHKKIFKKRLIWPNF
jgi:hypothetical protein